MEIGASRKSTKGVHQWRYDVFLSFRGKDTRKNFTDHLYAALLRRGIITFKDDRELERGNFISEDIELAIESSRFLVIIFSRNYASSSWCLEELVKIFECMKSGRQTVLPVFYDVNPSEVRKQTGTLGKAFAIHEENLRECMEKVERWRAALTNVANLSGWDLQNRGESEVIQEVVQEISRKLSQSIFSLPKDLIGIESYLEEISLYLNSQSDDVRFVGICGMGGIGKTTIARVVYETISYQFEGSCFLANVREVQDKHGLEPLQEQLLSEILMESNIRVWDVHKGGNQIQNSLCRKQVLVVLDDANQLDQLKFLTGMREWFGRGSRVIITTRDEHLLICHGVDKIFRIEGLNHEEALRLFCLKAFKKDYPVEGYAELSNHFVDYANGLPLAIDVLGSFLYGRSVNEWSSAFDRLKEIPNKEILDKLRISFDGLEEVEKKIFLDIACFFKGKRKDYVMKILECCGFFPEIGIRVLIDRSLITISENKVWMHDLIQEMGQEIIRQNCYQEPGRRSRLWLYEDAYHVFTKNMGTEEVEGLVLDFAKQEEEHLNAQAFSKMKRLRLLKLRNVCISQDLEYLSNELHYLEWYGYPFKSMPPNFQPEKLVELNLRCSHVELLWKEIKPLEKLKSIDLSHSKNIQKTPDFRGFPNLETLNLEGCTRLFDIHQSIGVLQRLDSLNLKDCKSLVGLPSTICDLKSLQVLILSGCTKIDKLPERLGDITCLEKLDLGRTGVSQLPSSVIVAKSLQVLSFDGCAELESKSWHSLFSFKLLSRKNQNPMALMLPSLLSFLHLRILYLRNCNLIDEAIPNDLSGFSMLEKLDLSGNDFVTLPASINQLLNLKVFLLDNCKKLKSLPELSPGIQYISLCDYKSLVTLPNPLEERKSSENFQCFTSNCSQLAELQGNNTEDFWLVVRNRLHSLLKKKPQGLYHFILTANISPGWFNCQGIGSSVRLQLPPNWCNPNWLGLAVSAFFAVDKDAVNDDMIYNDDYDSRFLQLKVDKDAVNDDMIYNDDYDSRFLQLKCFLHPSVEKSRSPPLTLTMRREECNKFDIHWLLYVPEIFYPGGVEWWSKCSHIDVVVISRGLEVKKCGVRLVYAEDIDDWI